MPEPDKQFLLTRDGAISFNVLTQSFDREILRAALCSCGIELKRTSCAYRVDFLLLLVKVYVHHFGLCKT